jgi:hypothetical protein
MENIEVNTSKIAAILPGIADCVSSAVRAFYLKKAK